MTYKAATYMYTQMVRGGHPWWLLPVALGCFHVNFGWHLVPSFEVEPGKGENCDALNTLFTWRLNCAQLCITADMHV